MSNFDSKLNLLVALVVGGVAYYYFSLPNQTPPPLDPWFQSHVVARNEPVLVKFGAEWCGPCRAIENELAGVARDMRGRLVVVRIDVDKHPELARHYRVSSIPRLLLFHQGQIVADRLGYADRQQLEQWVSAHNPQVAAR